MTAGGSLRIMNCRLWALVEAAMPHNHTIHGARFTIVVATDRSGPPLVGTPLRSCDGDSGAGPISRHLSTSCDNRPLVMSSYAKMRCPRERER